MPVEILWGIFFSTDSHNFHLEKNNIVLVYSGLELSETITNLASVWRFCSTCFFGMAGVSGLTYSLWN
jgi:hypothetical protein